MSRLLRYLLLAFVLATMLAITGCGEEQAGDVVDDEPSNSSPTGSPEDDKEPLGQIDFDLVELVTETAVDGEPAAAATALTDEAAVVAFSEQFSRDEMGVRLLAVFNDLEVPDNQALYGAVVAIGCDVPPDVVVTSTDSGLVITGTKVASPMKECFATMTTVALVLVEESVVG